MVILVRWNDRELSKGNSSIFTLGIQRQKSSKTMRRMLKSTSGTKIIRQRSLIINYKRLISELLEQQPQS